jgi:hypothetical protein
MPRMPTRLSRVFNRRGGSEHARRHAAAPAVEGIRAAGVKSLTGIAAELTSSAFPPQVVRAIGDLHRSPECYFN